MGGEGGWGVRGRRKRRWNGLRFFASRLDIGSAVFVNLLIY